VQAFDQTRIQPRQGRHTSTDQFQKGAMNRYIVKESQVSLNNQTPD
jgi:hypothetical protein